GLFRFLEGEVIIFLPVHGKGFAGFECIVAGGGHFLKLLCVRSLWFLRGARFREGPTRRAREPSFLPLYRCPVTDWFIGLFYRGIFVLIGILQLRPDRL